ncbi:hypothetical protein GGF32_006257 [Allomyces javanicus]|nr:hypothetical protein GGF32_006257 [Allomyces javanicus]
MDDVVLDPVLVQALNINVVGHIWQGADLDGVREKIIPKLNVLALKIEIVETMLGRKVNKSPFSKWNDDISSMIGRCKVKTYDVALDELCGKYRIDSDDVNAIHEELHSFKTERTLQTLLEHSVRKLKRKKRAKDSDDESD